MTSLRQLRALLSPRQWAGAGILLVGMATPLYVLCEEHLCMHWHMAHPPYPWWQCLNDLLWIAGFGLAVPMFLLSGLPGRHFAAGVVVFLLWVRIAFAGEFPGWMIFTGVALLFAGLDTLLYFLPSLAIRTRPMKQAVSVVRGSILVLYSVAVVLMSLQGVVRSRLFTEPLFQQIASFV